MPDTLVHLVRHGQVENPDRVLYGRLPGFNLSARGRAQAELLARWFADRPVAVVLASPLERAQQTAAPVAAALGLAVEADQRLVETANVFEGVAGGIAGYLLRHPRVWRRLLDPRRPSWGEPYADTAARVQAAVDDARKHADGREAVLVSHQAPIWIARRAYEGRSLPHWPGSRQCALASVTTLAFDGDLLRQVAYAEPAAAPLAGTGPDRPGA